MKRSATLLCLVLLVVVGCRQDTPNTDVPTSTSDVQKQPLFSDVTKSTGLEFVHAVSLKTPYFMPSSVGSGAALLDFDGDGLLDIYLLQNGGHESGSSNRLYHQSSDGTFRDVSPNSGLDVDGYGMGVAVGDVNNDGRVDVVVSEYGRVRLFQNQTEGHEPRFVDITDQAGIDTVLWSTSTCFVDYDRDGWLDLVVVNYVNYDPARWCADGSSRQDFCGPDAFNGRIANLFHNLGARNGGEPVQFQNVTVAAGFAEHPAPGLGVFCADFDGDRWPDVFIANDGQPNHLWINQKDGTFREEATLRGVGYNSMGKSEADMGIGIGDVNGDGRFDVFVTHLTSESHTLWLQQSPGIFQDSTATSGLMSSRWRGTGFGTVMADFDNDGALDLALGNGRVTRSTGPKVATAPELDDFWTAYAERDQLFLNNGSGAFTDVSEDNAAFSGVASVSRGLACGDLDNDGSLELLRTGIAGRVALFKSEPPRPGHWLLVRAIDPDLNRDAYGAEVYVNAGNRRWMRWINPGYSYLCSNDPRAHFGLGDVQQIDSIEIVWPDGSEEVFPGGPADQLVTLNKSDGQAK